MTKTLVEQDGYDFFDARTGTLITRIVVEDSFWPVENVEAARAEFLRRFPDCVFDDE